MFANTVQQLVVPDGLRGRLAASNILISIVSGGLLCLVGVGVIAATVPRFARWRVGDPP